MATVMGATVTVCVPTAVVASTVTGGVATAVPPLMTVLREDSSGADDRGTDDGQHREYKT